MRNFRELNVWIESLEIAKAVYALISELPEYEKFGQQHHYRKTSNSATHVSKTSQLTLTLPITFWQLPITFYLLPFTF